MVIFHSCFFNVYQRVTSDLKSSNLPCASTGRTGWRLCTSRPKPWRSSSALVKHGWERPGIRNFCFERLTEKNFRHKQICSSFRVWLCEDTSCRSTHVTCFCMRLPKRSLFAGFYGNQRCRNWTIKHVRTWRIYEDMMNHIVDHSNLVTGWEHHS